MHLAEYRGKNRRKEKEKKLVLNPNMISELLNLTPNVLQTMI